MSFVVNTTRWRHGGIHASIEIRGTATPRKLGPAMTGVLAGVWEGYTELTISFDHNLDNRARREVTAALEEIAREASGEDWVEGVDEGWSGPRYSIDDQLGPSFNGYNGNMDGVILGIWPNDRRFLALSTSDLQYSGTEWASVSHWHSGSMTSGSWYGGVALLEPGVLYEHQFRDEDGSYFSLLPEPTGPEAIADQVERFLTSEYIHGAEAWFSVLYGLVGARVSELGEFSIDMLPGTDNPGYEISSLQINPPDEAAQVLLRRCSPTDEQKRRLLDAITANLAERGEGETLDDFVGVWADIIAMLKQ